MTYIFVAGPAVSKRFLANRPVKTVPDTRSETSWLARR